MTATATATTTPTAPPVDPGCSAGMARLVLQQITTPQATSTAGAGASGAPPTANDAPLFEVKLELTETEIRFSPAFDASVENNFQQIVEQLLLDIKQTCDCMPRIVADNAPSEDDEDDDTATVDYEQELRREPKQDRAQELQERKKKDLELEQEQGDQSRRPCNSTCWLPPRRTVKKWNALVRISPPQ